mgnify:FL=1
MRSDEDVKLAAEKLKRVGEDLVAVGYGECTTRQKVVLDIDQQQTRSRQRHVEFRGKLGRAKR